MIDPYTIGMIASAVFSSQILTTLVQGWYDRKRNRISAESAQVESTIKWAESMREDIKILKEELAVVRKEASDCQLKWTQLKSDFDILKFKYDTYMVTTHSPNLP